MGRGLGFGLLLGLGLGLELGPFLTGPLNLPSDDGERHLNCTLFLSILIFYRPVSSLAFALLRENCAHAQMRSRARRGGQGKSPHPGVFADSMTFLGAGGSHFPDVQLRPELS